MHQSFAGANQKNKKNKTNTANLNFIQFKLHDNMGNPAAANFLVGHTLRMRERERKHGPISLAVQLCVHKYTEG